MIVDNRPGGAAMIGFGLVANAPPDGHTILVATTALAADPILFRPSLTTRATASRRSASSASCPACWWCRPRSPAKTLAELVALAKATPGGLNYGSAGNGSDNHLAAELFNYQSGIKALHVPYRGGGQVMTDLIGGGFPMCSRPCRRRGRS